MAKKENTFEEICRDIVAKKFQPVYILMGEEPFFMDNDGWYWVRCRKCGVETPGSDIKEIAENQWNRRVKHR